MTQRASVPAFGGTKFSWGWMRAIGHPAQPGTSLMRGIRLLTPHRRTADNYLDLRITMPYQRQCRLIHGIGRVASDNIQRSLTRIARLFSTRAFLFKGRRHPLLDTPIGNFRSCGYYT